MKASLILSLLFFLTLCVFGQHSAKLYVIRAFDPQQLFRFPRQYKKEIKFRAVGATIYYLTKDQKIDSLYVTAEDLLINKDTIAFTLSLDKKISVDKVLRINPIYYLESGNTKGNLPTYLLGNEEQLNRIKLKIKSDPSGATVYLVPKIYWEQRKKLEQFDPTALSEYVVAGGTTTITTDVQEYVYIAVFEISKRHYTLQFAPTYFNAVDSIYKKLK